MRRVRREQRMQRIQADERGTVRRDNRARPPRGRRNRRCPSSTPSAACRAARQRPTVAGRATARLRLEAAARRNDQRALPFAAVAHLGPQHVVAGRQVVGQHQQPARQPAAVEFAPLSLREVARAHAACTARRRPPARDCQSSGRSRQSPGSATITPVCPGRITATGGSSERQRAASSSAISCVDRVGIVHPAAHHREDRLLRGRAYLLSVRRDSRNRRHRCRGCARAGRAVSRASSGARPAALRIGFQQHGAARLDPQRLPATNQPSRLAGIRSSRVDQHAPGFAARRQPGAACRAAHRRH